MAKTESKKPKRTIKSEREKSAAKHVKEKKPSKGKSFIKKIFRPFRFLRYLVPPYFRNSWRELRQVKWPSRKETIQLTLAVFAFAIVFAALVTLIDYGLDKLFKQIFLK